MKKITTDEYKKRVYENYGDEFTVIGQFNGNDKPIRLFHSKCNKEFEMTAAYFLKHGTCKQCCIDKYYEDVYNLNPNIEVSNFTEKRNRVNCKCLVCNYEWNPFAYQLTRKLNSGCPNCFRKSQCTDIKEASERLHEAIPTIRIVGDYKNLSQKSKLHCDVCNHEWYAPVMRVLSIGEGCPVCGIEKLRKKFTRSNDEFIIELNRKNKNIIPLETYVNALTPIKFQCKICGHIWGTRPSHIINVGCGCPMCSESKGEKRIMEYLCSNNIKYAAQYTYDGLVGACGGDLRYDFYLPSYNLLIEYQGEQHFHPVDFNGNGIKSAEYMFERQVEHDRRKRDYAINHQIELLEISYLDFDDIENILSNKLLGMEDGHVERCKYSCQESSPE